MQLLQDFRAVSSFIGTIIFHHVYYLINYNFMENMVEHKLLIPAAELPTTESQLLPVQLSINGTSHLLQIEPWTSLLDLLRERLGLTGTKKGCDHGQCGACTILADGKRINACLALAVMYDGVSLTTIEGITQGEVLHPLQEAFIEHDALQCGYCTPGQICSALGLKNEGYNKTKEDIRELMSGNLCRCGAYSNIISAIEQEIKLVSS